MPQLCAHWPWLFRFRWPGGQALVSEPKSPLVVCRHQDSTAAWANTMVWLMPHLQATQRRISLVLPVKLPLTRGTILWSAAGASFARKSAGRCAPVRWLYGLLTPLLSCGDGWARTHAAHCAEEGSVAPGGRVPKNAGAAAGSFRGCPAPCRSDELVRWTTPGRFAPPVKCAAATRPADSTARAAASRTASERDQAELTFFAGLITRTSTLAPEAGQSESDAVITSSAARAR